MRHRIKKIPTLSKLNHKFNHHLHSDKSTYTYFYNKSKVKSLLYSPSIPLLGGVTLLLVLGVIINPSIDRTNKATAIEQDLGNGSKISLTILNNNIELANNATVSADTNPGIVSYINNIIRINTSRIGKYYVGVQAASDGSSNLIGLTHNDTITGVGENVAPNNFSDNTWGYALTSNISTSDSSLTYTTLPAYNANSAIQYTSETNPIDGNHDLKLTFAAKINANKPGDHYQTKAMVSVAADFLNLTTQFLGFSSINNMQDMTPEICSAARVGETKRLRDTRDNKYYWITKLADNNCWMTQNLDLDLWNEETDTPVTLTPETSDITESWTSTTGKSKFWVTSGNEALATTDAAYYDAGMYVYENPTTELLCGNIKSSDCTDAGWANVTNLTPSNDPSFGTKIKENNYNAHYLTGNYYSWGAATAKHGIQLDNDTMYPIIATTQSICAKGWQLATGNLTTSVKDYYKLLTSYGAYRGVNTWTYGDQDVRIAPLYFTYFSNINGDSLQVGNYASYTASVATSTTKVQDLYLYQQNANAGGSAAMASGRTIRCVAR